MTEEGREESLFGSDGGFEYTDSRGISQIVRQASHITNSPAN